MKEKSISILINRFLFVVVVTCLIACSIPANKPIEREILYSRYRDGVISKEERALYIWQGDTIIQEVIVLDSVKNVLYKERQALIKTENGLDVLMNGVRIPFLKFDSTTCSRSKHSLGFTIERCFKGRLNYKGYRNAVKFTEESLIIDGGKEVIYLDDNFAVIDKIRIGLGSYDSLLRVSQ